MPSKQRGSVVSWLPPTIIKESPKETPTFLLDLDTSRSTGSAEEKAG